MKIYNNFISSDFMEKKNRLPILEFQDSVVLKRLGDEQAQQLDEDKHYSMFPFDEERFLCNEVLSTKNKDIIKLDDVVLNAASVYSYGAPIVQTEQAENFAHLMLHDADASDSVTIINSGYGIEDGKVVLIDTKMKYSKLEGATFSHPLQEALAKFGLENDLVFADNCCVLEESHFPENVKSSDNRRRYILKIAAQDAHKEFFEENVIEILDGETRYSRLKELENRIKIPGEMQYFEKSTFSEIKTDSDVNYHYRITVNTNPIKFGTNMPLRWFDTYCNYDPEGFYRGFNVDMSLRGLCFSIQSPRGISASGCVDGPRSFVDSDFGKGLINLVAESKIQNTVVFREHGIWFSEKNGIVLDKGIVDKAAILTPADAYRKWHVIDLVKNTMVEDGPGV